MAPVAAGTMRTAAHGAGACGRTGEDAVNGLFPLVLQPLPDSGLSQGIDALQQGFRHALHKGGITAGFHVEAQQRLGIGGA